MIIIGHRGTRGLAPENTVASLRKALEFNVNMVEFDLRVTADNIVVLNHDPYIVSSEGKRFKIAEHSFADLRKVKPDMATFEEALQILNTIVPMYVEVKPGVQVAPIIKIFKNYAPQDAFLASYSQTILLELHEALPNVPLIVIEKWSSIWARIRAREVGTTMVCMNQKWLWPGFIRAVKRRGWTLYAYTVNDPSKAFRMAKHGLAGVVTDYPDRYQI